MGFGTKFRAVPNRVLDAKSTPGSGRSQEAIWHQYYDTQTYVDASTVLLTFFQASNSDKTLSNIDQGGTLPKDQYLQIYDVTADYLLTAPVSTAAGGVTGALNDLALLILGSAQRPTWTLTMSNKTYGPYSLSVLHGTGGPTGFGWGTFTAEESVQYAKNDGSPGWNYHGQVVLPEQQSFSFAIAWAAAANLDADLRIRVSLFGVLNRRVL